jgi:hypothetical protein
MASGLASFLGRRNVRAPAITVSTIQGSTIATTSITTSTLSLSSLTGSTINASSISFSSLSGSTITSNMLSLSTLTVSSINDRAPGVAAFSTLNVSTLNAMSSITTSSITASSIITASGFNSNIGNVLYTSLADSGQTAANLITTGMPATAPSGTVISGSYRATSASGEGRISMRLAYTFVVGTIYHFTFTGMQGSTDLGLRILQYNPGGFSNTEIGQATTLISTTAATISGSFTPSASGVFTGTIIFHFQALSFNPFVNFTAFSMTVGSMNVGIGTSTPTTTLDVATSTTAITSGILSSRYYLAGPGDNQDASGTNFDGPWYGLGWSGIAGLSGNPYVCLAGHAGVAMRSGLGFIQLLNNGYVGIGTTNPGQLFHVYGTNPYFYLGGTSTNYNVAQFSFNTISAGSTSNYVGMQIYNSPPTLCFNGLGNVGIGTTNPGFLLHGYGNIDGGVQQYFQNINAGTSAWTLIGCRNNTPSQLVMFLNSSTRATDGGQSVGTVRNDAGSLRLQSAGANPAGNIFIATTTGRVGIGKTDPAYLLDVEGGIQSSGTSKIVIQNSVDGGNTAGIFYWNIGDTAWASYMATSGAGKTVANTTACTGAFGFTLHAIRNRVANSSIYGFIWENHSETCLMSIRGDGAGGGMIGAWGVNTLSPAYTLDVAGSIRTNNDWYYITGAYGMYWTTYNRGFVSPEQAGNNYGNVATWGTPLNSWAGWGVGSKACFMNNGNEFGIHDNNWSWVIYCPGTSNRLCKIAGSVECSQNGDRLRVFVNGYDTGSGYFYVNSGGGYGMASDERIKKNIQPIAEEPSLTFIKNLQPSNFCLKEETGTHKHCQADGTETGQASYVCNCEQSGFIAQNVLAAAVQAGIPKSVCNNWYDYEQELGLPDEQRKAILGVSTVPIVSHLTNAVKSLIRQNTEQAAEIADLEAQLEAALARLEALEAR